MWKKELKNWICENPKYCKLWQSLIWEKAQKIKLWQNSNGDKNPKSKTLIKLKHSNCERKKTENQMFTKLKNLETEKATKL